MLGRLLHRLTYANVMATFAVFIAVSGGAYASLKLPNNSVGTKQLKKNAVTAQKIKNGSVTTAKLHQAAVTGSKVANNSLTGAQINSSTLGTVPNATSAANAAALGGKSPNQVDMWAVVNSNGTIARSSGGVNGTQLSGTGNFELTFPINVSQCVYNANGGASVSLSDPSVLTSSYIMVAPASGNPDSIVYKTVGSSGTAIGTEPAYVTVHC